MTTILEALEQEILLQDHFNANFDYALNVASHEEIARMEGTAAEEEDFSVSLLLTEHDIYVAVDSGSYHVYYGTEYTGAALTEEDAVTAILEGVRK